MAVSDHFSQSAQRQRVKILTVDPPTRKVEALFKDGSAQQISVLEVGKIFIWPKQGERWIVYRQGLNWLLGERFENSTETFPIEKLTPGDAKISATTIYNASGQALKPPPALVSVLPNPATDGLEVYFQTQTMTAAGVAPWHLRYRTLNPNGSPNANTNKWDVLWAQTATSMDQSGEVMPNTANATTDFTNSNPLEVYLPGVYTLEAGSQTTVPANAQANLNIVPGLNGSGGANLIGVSWIGTTNYVPLLIPPFSASLAAGWVRLRGSTNAQPVTWTYKWLKLVPLRVG